MKALSLITAICILLLMVCGCGDPNQTEGDISSNNSTESVVEDTSIADIDLTTLNSTMVYSQVYDIVSNPDRYLGKTIKMRGNVGVYHDTATDIYYYACIIPDATACCQQGIEFLLKGDPSNDKYPATGTEITIEGVFETYQEGDQTYPRLKNAELL